MNKEPILFHTTHDETLKILPMEIDYIESEEYSYPYLFLKVEKLGRKSFQLNAVPPKAQRFIRR